MHAPELTANDLFLGALFTEGGIHFILFDTRRDVAALTKILLLGTISHHAGMGDVSLLMGVLGNHGFIRHSKYSERGCASLNATSGISFHALNAIYRTG
jgi:hypothetical protein